MNACLSKRPRQSHRSALLDREAGMGMGKFVANGMPKLDLRQPPVFTAGMGIIGAQIPVYCRADCPLRSSARLERPGCWLHRDLGLSASG